MIWNDWNSHWNTLGLNFCQLMPSVTPWPHEVPTLRCQGRAGCRPCWIQRPTSRTREKWGSKRMSDMVDKEYQRITVTISWWVSWVSCHEYWWIRFSIGTKPHIVLILSVAWQICVCKELPWRWSLILKFQLFVFCVVALLQNIGRRREVKAKPLAL